MNEKQAECPACGSICNVSPDGAHTYSWVDNRPEDQANSNDHCWFCGGPIHTEN